jgi:hypothetical protein
MFYISDYILYILSFFIPEVKRHLDKQNNIKEKYSLDTIYIDIDTDNVGLDIDSL